MTKIYVLNTGGTLGMVGNPLRPAKSAAELLEGIVIPDGIELTLVDFPEKQDSTDIMHDDRVAFGKRVAEAYDTHDAFVIFHGTDSLAETAAFLAMFFKLTLQKPLFVIGAQMTKDEAGSDVPMQIGNSFRVAASFARNDIVGVYSVSIGDVLDGTRIKKRRESDFAAFHTPGRYPVAQAWPRIAIQDGVRYKDTTLDASGLVLDEKFARRVVGLRVSADAPPTILISAVEAEILDGVILECKGAGNIPDRKWKSDGNEYSWIDAIQIATDAGVHVGILSPFEDGRVILERYELGQKAKDAGAISLESLTPAMADIKFRQAIARFPDDPAKIQEYISTNILGELLSGFEDTSG